MSRTIVNIKDEFDKECKKILKKNIPKNKDLLIQIVENLIELFNELSEKAAFVVEILNEGEERNLKKTFESAIEKISRVFIKLDLRYWVPDSEEYGSLIVKTKFLDETANYTVSEDFESESESEGEEIIKMNAQTAISIVTSVLQMYDGSYEKLSAFLAQIDVLKAAITDENLMPMTINLVKARITNPTILLGLKDSDDFDTIKEEVEEMVKKPDRDVILMKLKTFRQGTKDNIAYAAELKNISTELINAYIGTGMDYPNAESLTKISLIDSIKYGTSNQTLKLTMNVGKFDSIDEVLTKVLSAPREQSVFFSNAGQSNRYKSKNRGGYKGRNFNPNYRKQDNNDQSSSKNFESRNNGKQNYYGKKSGYKGHKNVHYTESKNEQGPGQMTAGNFQ